MRIKIFIFLIFILLSHAFVCAQEEYEYTKSTSIISVMGSDTHGVVISICHDKDGWFECSSSQPLEKERTFSINLSQAAPESDSNATIGTEGVFLNGKKEGIWRKTIGFRVLREETYYDNVLHGISRMFSFDGKLLFQTFFEHGTGYYCEYNNDNVQIFVKGNLVHGKQDGPWMGIQ